jgi:hypothetical protein
MDVDTKGHWLKLPEDRHAWSLGIGLPRSILNRLKRNCSMGCL